MQQKCRVFPQAVQRISLENPSQKQDSPRTNLANLFFWGGQEDLEPKVAGDARATS